jgi:tRNA (guanine-N7-)-methyltransferase
MTKTETKEGVTRLRRLYGRRHGKTLTASRRALVDDVLPRLMVPTPTETGTLTAADLFDPTPDELWMEIGFGKGEHLVWQARQNPSIGFIGVEPFVNGLAALIDEIDGEDVDNIRLFDDDAALLLQGLAPDSLSRVFILFPDPWPKARHHKRRFIRPDNLDLVSAALGEGGELRIGTDHADYGNWIVRHMHRRSDFDWLAECPTDWRERPDDWPQTRYEAKAVRQGRSSIYLRYRRNDLFKGT